ncbi:MAG: hypothetical protein OXU25_00420, partial [Thaumarchaeota archaeon]|nr:hypothetical protein [Nitrososphaerota archaeon]
MAGDWPARTSACGSCAPSPAAASSQNVETPRSISPSRPGLCPMDSFTTSLPPAPRRLSTTWRPYSASV